MVDNKGKEGGNACSTFFRTMDEVLLGPSRFLIFGSHNRLRDCLVRQNSFQERIDIRIGVNSNVTAGDKLVLIRVKITFIDGLMGTLFILD